MFQLQRIPVIFIIAMLFLSSFIPVFAEVTSFQLDKIFYTKGDNILFSGTVDQESTGLVTIVIRDSNDEFVLLTQAVIESNDTFKKELNTNERFDDHGIHNATAFVKDLAKGQTISFDFSQDGTLPIPSITSKQSETALENEPDAGKDDSNTKKESESNTTKKPKLADFVDPTKDPQHYLDRYYNEPEYKAWFDRNYPELTIEEAVGPESTKKPKLADFVDPTKDPQHYLDRYYNEPEYKAWFDRNYPELTIEEAIGLGKLDSNAETIEKNLENAIVKDVIPEAEAIQTIKGEINDNAENKELALLGLAFGGLAVLFGAIYGIKRKVDTNSETISQNRESIRRKVFGAILNNNPEDVIKNRLAHGEITVTEYNNLKKALQRK